jgi:uroporphyrinogen decarboxylase
MINELFNKNSKNKKTWFLRQAGRHLPEYKKIRAKKESFFDFCFDVESVVEATLQPIIRYDLDAAIIFSDILVIPYILNQEINFIKGFGPKLSKFDKNNILTLKIDNEKLYNLQNNYLAIKKTRDLLNKNKSLIGFCGGPWTVACYMIDGTSKNNFSESLNWLKNNKKDLIKLLEIIVDVSVFHLKEQYKNGCDTLMLFESWGGIVPEYYYKEILFNPAKEIRKRLRKEKVLAPFICFPRGLNKYILPYDDFVKPNILSIDQNISMEWAVNNFDKKKVLQGNINPELLVSGGIDLYKNVENIMNFVHDRNHIFNTGHGIHPDTPIENIIKILENIRKA